MKVQRFFTFFISCICAILLFGCAVSHGEMTIQTDQDFYSFPEDQEIVYLEENTEVIFKRHENTYTWMSDVERVTWVDTEEVFLADSDPAYYLCGDVIPGGRHFELFPYHFYYQEEKDKLLGERINYSLILKNITDETVTIEIEGIGTTTDWEHYKAWEGAFHGEGQATIELQAGEIYTLWNEKRLTPGYPWSAIVLGKTSGDIWVADYAYLGEEDPGIEHAEQMPDIAWPPYLLASFTRGTVDWNAADIIYFPDLRDSKQRIPFSRLEDKIYSIAIAYSPGGPVDDLCKYKVIEPTFEEDILMVEDPLSGKSHLFFGGNYPIMYHFSIPLVNDTEDKKVARFYLCSNDVFNVDTIAGVWIEGEMHHKRVPAIGRNKHWPVFKVLLEPGQTKNPDFIVVPLGSRWGGMIASLEIQTLP